MCGRVFAPAPLEQRRSAEMHASYLDVLLLILFGFSIAFMLWFLWNVTLQLNQSRNAAQVNTIPIEVQSRHPIGDQSLRSGPLDIKTR
jgi:hypothetical protein